MRASFVVTVEHDADFPYSDYDDTDWESVCSEDIKNVEWGLIDKAVDLLDRLLDESEIDYTEYDVDVYYNEQAYVDFINSSDKNKDLELMKKFQKELENLNVRDEIEVYGKQISGGYPSYDPPEYEEFEVNVDAWFSVGDTVYFEED